MHRVAINIAACCSLMLAGCSQGQNPSPPTSRQAAVTPKITQYRVLISFNGRFGTHPTGSLAQFNKLLFGTATSGSANGQGALFRVNPDGKDDRLLHSFKGGEDGCSPTGGGVFTSRGSSFYGTTTSCGNATKGGLVFSEYAGGNQFHVWHRFDLASDGGNPEGGLLPIGATLYGTTPNGGAHGQGTIYSLDTKTAAFSVLHAFGAVKDAAGPVAALTEFDGKLFGTSRDGGSDGLGLLRFHPRNGAEKVLHSFDGTDGARPTAALLTWGGMLYGLTPRGGLALPPAFFLRSTQRMVTKRSSTTLGMAMQWRRTDRLSSTKTPCTVRPDAGVQMERFRDPSFVTSRQPNHLNEFTSFLGKPDGAHPRGGLLYLNVDRQEQLFGQLPTAATTILGLSSAWFPKEPFALRAV